MTDWLTGYAYRKAITIDADFVDADLSYFPALVSLVNDSGVGTHALSTGYDIRFTSYNGSTLLDYERENFVIGGGVCNAVIWVKVPALSSSSDTVIYLYYGKSNATDGQDINGVWDDGGSNNFKGVWHLKETGTGAANDYKDSTQYANNSTNTTNEPTRVTGKIGYGQSFDGADQTIQAGTNASLAVQSHTLSGWVGLSEYSATTRIIASKSTSILNTGIEWGVRENGNLGFAYNDGGVQGWYIASSAISLNIGYYISFVWAPGTLKIYTNGSQSGNDITTTAGTIVYSSDLFEIGDQNQNVTWLGTLDEIRVSNTTRSPGWISAEYNNQNSPSSFYSLSSEEPYFIQKTFTSSNDIQLSKIFTATNDLLLYKPFSNSNDIGMNKTFACSNDIQLSKIFTATNDLLLYKSFSNSNDIGINRLLTSSNDIQLSGVFSNFNDVQISKTFESTNAILAALLTKLFSSSNDIYTAQAFSSSNDIQLQNIFASANDIILYRSFSNSNDIQLSGVFSNFNDVQISKTFESTNAILAALLTKLFSSSNDIYTAQAFSSSNDIQLSKLFSSSSDILAILSKLFSSSNDIQILKAFSSDNDIQIYKLFSSSNDIITVITATSLNHPLTLVISQNERTLVIFNNSRAVTIEQ